jgi:DNA polymerase-3 subunit gamma/tau
MSESTSLYRRHRPGSFDEVVGQTHVVRTLRNAVAQGKVHHAYLFVGSRGTGKTSMAKILARSLNCERGGPTVNPCGECESCVTIAAGTSIDVIEMDAASNRSVDDVRDLRERVAYAPAGGHWKVYILDEAHMLTKEAWNAFLKTLEEPPPNTVFVLATTESHKVMATIADRCQRFDFQRPSLEQISEVLNRVAATESIEVDEGAVAMIARSASGSFRDALGTLDQLVAFGGEHVELKDVLEMLGAADADLLFDAVDAVVSEDPKGVLLGVEKMARSGRDPSQFARDLLAHLRHLLLVQTTGEVPTSFVVTATDTARIQAQASAIRPANLIRTIDELAAALTAVREGDDARLAVEIALLKAARPDLDPDTAGLLRRIERLEGQQTGGRQAAGPVTAGDPPPLPVAKASSGGVPPTVPPAAEAPPADDPPPVEEGEAEVAAPDGEAEAPPAKGAPPVGGDDREDSPGRESPRSETGPAGQEPLSLEQIQRIWPAVLQKLAETVPALAATLEGARPVSYGEEGLQVGFPPDMTFNKKKADSADRRDTVAAAFAAVTGTGLRPTYVVLEGEAPPDTPAPGSDEVDKEQLLERLKSEFDAEEVG